MILFKMYKVSKNYYCTNLYNKDKELHFDATYYLYPEPLIVLDTYRVHFSVQDQVHIPKIG